MDTKNNREDLLSVYNAQTSQSEKHAYSEHIHNDTGTCCSAGNGTGGCCSTLCSLCMCMTCANACCN